MVRKGGYVEQFIRKNAKQLAIEHGHFTMAELRSKLNEHEQRNMTPTTPNKLKHVALRLKIVKPVGDRGGKALYQYMEE